MVKNKPDVLHQCTYVVVVKPEVTGSGTQLLRSDRCLKENYVCTRTAFFQSFDGNERNWIIRNLEF